MKNIPMIRHSNRDPERRRTSQPPNCLHRQLGEVRTGRLVGLLLLVLTTAGSACGTKAPVDEPAPAADTDFVDTVTVPEDFRMVFGQGGGFTGMWNGFTIEADGQVMTWAGRAHEPDSLASGRLSNRDMAELWNRIRQVNLLDRTVRETGNMTAFIELTAGGRSRRLSWVPGTEGVEPPISDLDSFYRHSLRIAREAVEQ